MTRGGAPRRLNEKIDPRRKEKQKVGRHGLRAFIAYGSAKHLWNNGATKYIVGKEKRKYLARERTRKIGFYCSRAAGVPRSFVCAAHTRSTYTR